MSIEQTKVIDFIGRDKVTGDLILTVSDHLEWSDEIQELHIELLQEKINTYLSYIESGQALNDFPDTINPSFVICISGKSDPIGKGIEFILKAREVIEAAGYGFRFELIR